MFHYSGSCHDQSYGMRFFELARISGTQYKGTAFWDPDLYLDLYFHFYS